MFKRLDGTVSDTLDLVVTKKAKLGYQTAQFSLPYSTRVKEQEVIEIDDYLYRVKALDMTEQDRYIVNCSAYFDGLESKRIDRIGGFGMTLGAALDEVLEGTGWTYEFEQTIAGAFALDIEYETALSALEDLADIYYANFWYDTKEKKIIIWRKGSYRSSSTVVQFNGANSYIQYKSDSNNLVTRLIPIGKEKTTINLVNEGCLWCSNNQYTDDIIVGYYINDKITNPDDLKTIAENQLKDMSRPQTEYTIKSHLLGESLEIGDGIRILDKVRDLDTVLAVNEVVSNKSNPSESYIKVGDVIPAFEDTLQEYQKAQQKVNKNNLLNLNELYKYYF